jgi:hypothetical protein
LYYHFRYPSPFESSLIELWRYAPLISIAIEHFATFAIFAFAFALRLLKR